jgi:hypothetical protein
MKTKNKKIATAIALMALFGMAAQAQTPFYSVNGNGGTGGGTAGVSATPSTAPSGSSALTLLSGTSDFTFGTGVDSVAGESIVNTGTYGSGTSGVLDGTLGNAGTLSQLTMTMWINPGTSPANNNERLVDINSTQTGQDGNNLFLGINAGGGLQFYVNGTNPNTVGTDISNPTVFNGGLAQVSTWYFVGIVYDTVNSVYSLYTGTTASSATLQYSFTGLANTSVAFGSGSSISLMDRTAANRTFNGSMDDFNLYSGALTASQLDALQAAEISPAPEPSTVAIAGFGFGALITMMRRRKS